MYRLTSKIEISGAATYVLDRVTAVEITRDTESLTTTCRITLPKKIRWDGQSRVPIQRGDSVRVSLGYDENLQLAFVGYVTAVGAKTPIELQCEDEMYLLKQRKTQKRAYRSVTLTELLADQGLTDVSVMGEQRLGAYRVKADTVAALLDDLKEQGIRAFYRLDADGRPRLTAGVLFDHAATPAQVFATGCNIISDQSLEQQKADEVKVSVKVVSMQPDNRTITVELGDKDGEQRTLYCYGKTADEARAWGEQEVKRMRRDGLRGSLTTFGHTLVDVLDSIGIVIDGERRGIYGVKKNVIRFGTDGYRQELTIGQRVGD